MTRLASIIERVERGEDIDPERECLLQALDLAQIGETFKDEMLAIYEECNDLNRYQDLKEAEFWPNGAYKTLKLRNRNIDTIEYFENGLPKHITTREETNGG